MEKIYHTIIIGSGIAGATVAYTLKSRGVDILLLDRSSVAASGGSGAAGAFVSPKIGKGSPLQRLTNEAYLFARDFYLQNFPKEFSQTGVIRIPKDLDDAKKFLEYEPYNQSEYSWMDARQLDSLGINSDFDSFLFADAGLCDAPALCRTMVEDIPKEQLDVSRIEYVDGCWIVSDGDRDYLASTVVLSTGYQNQLFDMRYMGVRGTWGSRGDYYSTLALSTSMHKQISISANIDGIIKIGATHLKSTQPCRVCDGKPLASLEERASTMVDTSDFKLKETFCGMRSGSKDYFPLVGRVIAVESMLTNYPNLPKGAKPPLEHLPNLYIANGYGGRGFVFAPMMADALSKLILDGIEVDRSIDPDRLFLKWCRRELAATYNSP
ncbi:FAD dependent oxidoreductase [hydrothermal vent metagenome]|uniref:FAD dependent oxidoreductase n=1 Tax=hydrothermal vent metagenome TaxID=652676 RepID=A0A1W1BE45_9ZZZZ